MSNGTITSAVVPISEKCFPDSQLVLMSDLEKNINRVHFPLSFRGTKITF